MPGLRMCQERLTRRLSTSRKPTEPEERPAIFRARNCRAPRLFGYRQDRHESARSWPLDRPRGGGIREPTGSIPGHSTGSRAERSVPGIRRSSPWPRRSVATSGRSDSRIVSGILQHSNSGPRQRPSSFLPWFGECLAFSFLRHRRFCL